MDIASKVFVTIFALEFILKTIAMGFVVKKNSYLRSPLNVLDFVCLITGVLEQTTLNVDTFLMLRMMRVLKPLRSIKALP